MNQTINSTNNRTTMTRDDKGSGSGRVIKTQQGRPAGKEEGRNNNHKVNGQGEKNTRVCKVEG